MAFKVKILSIILFICLIESLHSASHGRVERGADTEETTAPEKSEEPSEHKEKESHTTEKSKHTTESNADKNKLPFDVNSLIDNISQIFNTNGSPDWMKEASNWLPMFGRH